MIPCNAVLSDADAAELDKAIKEAEDDFSSMAGMGWAFINMNSYPMVVELSKDSDVDD